MKKNAIENVAMGNAIPQLKKKADFITKTMEEGLAYFDKKIKGFASKDAILTGVETRSSSPVTILRNKDLVSNIKGLYPCGEGAGYAGGIMSAAVDGIKCAISALGN